MDIERVARQATLERLDTLVGRWSMEAQFPGAPPSGPIGQTVFAWLPGRQFLSQRWQVSDPDVPTASRSSA